MVSAAVPEFRSTPTAKMHRSRRAIGTAAHGLGKHLAGPDRIRRSPVTSAHPSLQVTKRNISAVVTVPISR